MSTNIEEIHSKPQIIFKSLSTEMSSSIKEGAYKSKLIKRIYKEKI